MTLCHRAPLQDCCGDARCPVGKQRPPHSIAAYPSCARRNPQCILGQRPLRAVPVTRFSSLTHLTNDSSDFRSTRAAALIFTWKDCTGPLLSSMLVCRAATRHHEARSNLWSGTGWTPLGQVAGEWPAACEATACYRAPHKCRAACIPYRPCTAAPTWARRGTMQISIAASVLVRPDCTHQKGRCLPVYCSSCR